MTERDPSLWWRRRRGPRLAVGYLIAGVVIVLIGVVDLAGRFVFGITWTRVYGQVNLYGIAFASDQRGGCTGQGAYADLREGATIRMSGPDGGEHVRLGPGRLSGDGGCVFSFAFSFPGKAGTYTFDAGHGVQRTVPAPELSHPVILSIVPPSG